MKKIKFGIITVMMLLLCVPFVVAQTAREESQNNAAIAERPGKYFSGFANYLRRAGRPQKLYKGDQFAKSGTAAEIYRSLYYATTYGLARQDNPAITAYWASQGLKKEIYQIKDSLHMWSVFTPNGIYKTYKKGHKFPLVFCLHGYNNNILLAETYGFAKLGGKKGFITVVPWANNERSILNDVPRILDTLRAKGYPIDESRIYAAGFSLGGVATMRVGIAFPNIFAAIAAGGAGPASLVGKNDTTLNSWLPWVGFTAGMYANAAKYKLPVMFFGGTCDVMPLSANAENWIKISGAIAPKVTKETVANIIAHSGYGVERMTGLPFNLDEMKIIPLDDTYYYIGSYYNPDGVCTFRVVAVDGAPHWLMKSEAPVAWKFLSQFARDRKTGKLLYTKQVN